MYVSLLFLGELESVISWQDIGRILNKEGDTYYPTDPRLDKAYDGKADGARQRYFRKEFRKKAMNDLNLEQNWFSKWSNKNADYCGPFEFMNNALRLLYRYWFEKGKLSHEECLKEW